MRKTGVAGYWSWVFGNTREFRALAGAEDPELTAVWEGLDLVQRNQYLFEATGYGVKRWEEMLGAAPEKGEDLDLRKQRIFMLMNEQLPYTYRMLIRQLDLLLGEENYQLELRPEDYAIQVTANLEYRQYYPLLDELLERMLPANLERRRYIPRNTRGTVYAPGIAHRKLGGVHPLEYPRREWNAAGAMRVAGASHRWIHGKVPLNGLLRFAMHR